MTKAEIRLIYKEKRSGISIHQTDKWNDLILINFQKIPQPFVRCVHTYLASLKLGEIDTASIVRYLRFLNPNLVIAVPKIDVSLKVMSNYQFKEDMKMKMNSYGINEPTGGTIIYPEEIDLVLVPLLAFDKHGYRVGYGKGFYDKFLSECRVDVVKIGLSYFDPVDEIRDINEFDVRLDYCITPNEIFEF
ncbi:MAG: 5-formyltetrahydrofolate cyclo-ligase [Ginsengibacter sp.]